MSAAPPADAGGTDLFGKLYCELRCEMLKAGLKNGLLLLLLLSFLHASACRTADPELKRNRQVWREQKIANYDLVMARFAGGQWSWVPVEVKVRDFRAISLEPIRERLEPERIEEYQDFDTVEKTFDRIQEYYSKGDKVIVTYNQEFGYPESIRVFPKEGGMDSAFFLEIREFEIIRN